MLHLKELLFAVLDGHTQEMQIHAVQIDCPICQLVPPVKAAAHVDNTEVALQVRSTVYEIQDVNLHFSNKRGLLVEFLCNALHASENCFIGEVIRGVHHSRLENTLEPIVPSFDCFSGCLRGKQWRFRALLRGFLPRDRCWPLFSVAQGVQ